MPTIIEIEKANSEYVYSQLSDKAFAALSAAFARMIPAPVYPGGPVQCPAHDTNNWSADKIAAQARSLLLAAAKDLVDAALASLPQSAKDHLDANEPGWSECTDAIDAVRDTLEALPEN